jgi:hypothetical protein
MVRSSELKRKKNEENFRPAPKRQGRFLDGSHALASGIFFEKNVEIKFDVQADG